MLVEVWDGLYGPGFYALDIGPKDATRDQLRWECFGDSRPDHPMDGVLVLNPVFADVQFARVEERIWLMNASWGSRTSIEGMIVAIGEWTSSGWEVEEYE
ncbi:MAG TPA: hypothetical protein VLJ42_10205 [Solirubrobacteraceae bacterium]|nr:hypothetical protein [Solirubrobacteraceae bacterium]